MIHAGFFEPIKLQMKLQTSSLKGKDWDEVLPAEDQEKWREILKSYVNIPEIIIPRFCLPEKRAEKGKSRLICLADAAEFAGGGGCVCRGGNQPRHMDVLSPSR